MERIRSMEKKRKQENRGGILVRTDTSFFFRRFVFCLLLADRKTACVYFFFLGWPAPADGRGKRNLADALCCRVVELCFAARCARCSED